MDDKPTQITWKKVLPLLIFVFVAGIILVWFVPSKIIPISWDFRNNLWGPSNLLIQHRSPYNIHAIFDASNAIWMPVVIGLFFPIGYLPLQWASNLWFLLNFLSLCLLVILMLKDIKRSIIWVPLTIFALVLFPSTVSHLVLGQISLMICLALFILIKYQNRLKPLIIGLLLAFSFTKPQLVLLFLPAFLFVYFRSKTVKQFIAVILSSIMWIILLCAPLFIFYPNWIPDFFHNFAINNAWFYPSIYSFLLAGSVSSGIALILAGIYLLIGVGLSIYLTFKLDESESLLWCLAITPIFSPIIWSWDFVLIFPLIIYLAIAKKSKSSSWILFSGLGACFLAFTLMKLFKLVNEQLTFWVPLAMVLTLLISRIFQNPKVQTIPQSIP